MWAKMVVMAVQVEQAAQAEEGIMAVVQTSAIAGSETVEEVVLTVKTAALGVVVAMAAAQEMAVQEEWFYWSLGGT